MAVLKSASSSQSNSTQAAKRVQTQLTPTQVVTSLLYSASSQTTFRLDRTMYYRSINLRLTGSITTGATTTSAHLKAGDEWGIVKLIEIVANGGNVLRSITGEQLAVLNYLLTGYAKQKCTLVGAAGTYSFDSMLPLWMILPNGIGKSPIDTTLNATLLSDLFIRITWGVGTDINSGNAVAVTVSAATAIEVSNDLAFFLDKSIIPTFALTQLQTQSIQTNIPTTGKGTSGQVWQVPVGQTYAWFLLNMKSTGTQQDLAQFGTGLIQSGTNQLYNTDLNVERYMNQYRQYVPANSFSSFFGNTLDVYDGWTLWVMPKARLLTESLNLVNYQNCNMYIQNNGATAIDLTVIPLTIYPTKQITG